MREKSMEKILYQNRDFHCKVNCRSVTHHVSEQAWTKAGLLTAEQLRSAISSAVVSPSAQKVSDSDDQNFPTCSGQKYGREEIVKKFQEKSRFCPKINCRSPTPFLFMQVRRCDALLVDEKAGSKALTHDSRRHFVQASDNTQEERWL